MRIKISFEIDPRESTVTAIYPRLNEALIVDSRNRPLRIQVGDISTQAMLVGIQQHAEQHHSRMMGSLVVECEFYAQLLDFESSPFSVSPLALPIKSKSKKLPIETKPELGAQPISQDPALQRLSTQLEEMGRKIAEKREEAEKLRKMLGEQAERLNVKLAALDRRARDAEEIRSIEQQRYLDEKRALDATIAALRAELATYDARPADGATRWSLLDVDEAQEPTRDVPRYCREVAPLELLPVDVPAPRLAPDRIRPIGSGRVETLSGTPELRRLSTLIREVVPAN